MKKIGFYAGSFDPFTVGHLRIVLEALCKYDEVIIGVGENASKSDCLFEAEERIELIEQSIYDFVNWYAGRFLSDIQPSETEKIAFERLQNERDCISFLAYQSSTVDVALACGATALIRGKRIGCDDEDEMRLASINQRLLAIRKAHLSMDLIPLPKEDLTFVSSSAFKGLCEIYEYIAAMDFVAPKVHNAAMQKYLKDFFVEVYTNIVGEDGLADKTVETEWNNLVAAYGNREYHNFSHLAYGINFIIISKETHPDDFEIEKVILAWFYHDLIIKGNNAEEKTAKKVYSLFKDEEIANLVRATNHQGEAPKNTFAEKLISDIDLAILADKKNYFGYCVQLVRENSAIKAETFCKRRCEFLQSMLEKDKIFLTPFFGEKFEEAAKRNMQKELLKLSGTL